MRQKVYWKGSIAEMTEERISQPEDRAIKIINIMVRKILEKTEQRLRVLWNSNQRSRVHVLSTSEGKQEEYEKVLKNI